MLTSKIVYEGVSSILDSLGKSDLEGAKRKLGALGPEVKTEKERGSLLAAAGILASMTRAKDGTMQSWDHARIERAAGSIISNQLADDFDQGYADTLMSYSKLMQGKA
ncbi:MAG: hypothetical protein OK438_07045 [Thaumarchaeota archaeon]|nr:hypothetical protein [Nitrososphaerota archaeon]